MVLLFGLATVGENNGRLIARLFPVICVSRRGKKVLSHLGHNSSPPLLCYASCSHNEITAQKMLHINARVVSQRLK